MINNVISLEIEQVLIGSLLGDGGLRVEKRGKNAYFREQHSVKQRTYLLWKKEILGFFKPKLKEFNVFDRRTNKYYQNVLIWTKTHPLFTKYYKQIYENNKKNFKNFPLNKIGLLALAVWYCDDGSFGYINQNGKIATYLNYEDNVLIAKFLKEKFDIKCSINRDREKYHLYFSVIEIKKFLNLIEDHIPECMKYKLGPLNIENHKRLEEENLKRREKDRIRYNKYMKNPIKRALIRKQHRENRRRRLQNPEYRRKYNEYHRRYRKIKEKEYKEGKK